METANTKIFYHLTAKENVESILKRGLMTGKEIGKNNEWFGKKGDSNFTYLFSRESKVLHDFVPLAVLRAPYNFIMEKISKGYDIGFWSLWKFSAIRVELPANFIVERDYDQVYVYAENEDAGLSKALKTLSEREIDVSVTRDYTSILNFVDNIPEKTWNNNSGTYRIQTTIPPKHLSKISWIELLFKK